MIYTYILIFIICLVGLLLGLYVGFCILNFFQKNEKSESQMKKKHFDNFKRYLRNLVKKLKKDNRTTLLNKVNIIQDTPSYTENYYGIDVYGEEQDVKNKMKTQDEKYNILKSK